MRELTDFTPFCETASAFWKVNVLPEGERIILVEAMSQDLRVVLRNLTIANALRRLESARLVVFTGADEEWNKVVWTYFDLDEISRLAKAYGAAEIFDVHELVDHRVAGAPDDTRVLGVPLGGELTDSAVQPDDFDKIVTATACRLDMTARIEDSLEGENVRASVAVRSSEFAKVYEALFRELDVMALVTSHVDYNNFGLAVEAAVRHDVPVLFPQSTGGLKAHAIFPEKQLPGLPVRAGLTAEIGRYFDEQIWAHREKLRRSAELTMWRLKGSLGWPAWWRPVGSDSHVDARGSLDRAELRGHAARRTGLDANKPTITVYNHAVSDALWTNVEAFRDLGAWYEDTAQFASQHSEVNWLFLEHPSQDKYDRTDFFGTLARGHQHREHMSFMHSIDLSRNLQASISDTVVTVRGSVSTEFPAMGIPAIQAGWSDWSHCGFTTVADTPSAYFATLQRHICGLLAGEDMITEDQVDRARLWAWFYRSASDVPSPLVQQWQVGEGDSLFNLLATNMMQVEPDGDPAFQSVRRLWDRREPFVSRFDWGTGAQDWTDALSPLGQEP